MDEFPKPSLNSNNRPRRPLSSGDAGRTPPPSSYAFPFQAYSGNPDPLPSRYIYSRRRASLESLSNINNGSEPPNPPFLSSSSSSSSSIHRHNISSPPSQVFPAPFLSPASRPTSSVWSWSPHSTPPQHTQSTSNIQLYRPPMPSTVLPKPASASSLAGVTKPLAVLDEQKPDSTATTIIESFPVLHDTDSLTRSRFARAITLTCLFLGAIAAAGICFIGVTKTKSRMLVESQLCLVMNEDFSGQGLNDQYWTRDVGLGGMFSDDPPTHAHTFHISTNSDQNLFFKDGQMYILPTLTSDDNPDYWKDGQTFPVDGCTITGSGNGGGSGASGTTGGDGNATSTDSGGGNSTSTSGNSTISDNGGGDTNNSSVNTIRSPNLSFPFFKRAPPIGAGKNLTNSSTTSPSNSTSSQNTTSPITPPTTGPVGPNPGFSSDPCQASTSAALGTIINPALSSRVSTRGKVGVRYGRVEVTAKVSSGDWLWPAIWLLPENNTYGNWPLSGEIDLLDSRGNSPSYPAQGSNFARSTMTFGLDSGLQPILLSSNAKLQPLAQSLFGFLSLKRSSFSDDFHTYVVEWDEQFVRFWIDRRTRTMLEVNVNAKKNFWNLGNFPPTAQNTSTGSVVVVQNPWTGGGAAAPFDQRFYLNIELAVGGTTGWFPDDKGGKPWQDLSKTAMRDFASAQGQWAPTWPDNEDNRAFRIQSVKMWSKDC